MIEQAIREAEDMPETGWDRAFRKEAQRLIDAYEGTRYEDLPLDVKQSYKEILKLYGGCRPNSANIDMKKRLNEAISNDK